MAYSLSLFIFSRSQTEPAGDLLLSVFLPSPLFEEWLGIMAKQVERYKNTSADVSRYGSNPSSLFLQLVLFCNILDQHCCKCLRGSNPYGEWWRQRSGLLPPALPTQYQLFVTDDRRILSPVKKKDTKRKEMRSQLKVYTHCAYSVSSSSTCASHTRHKSCWCRFCVFCRATSTAFHILQCLCCTGLRRWHWYFPSWKTLTEMIHTPCLVLSWRIPDSWRVWLSVSVCVLCVF